MQTRLVHPVHLPVVLPTEGAGRKKKKISPGNEKKFSCVCYGGCAIIGIAKEADEAFKAITQKQTPGEAAALRGSFCAYLPLPCLSSHLQM